jgi:hypothetical protein
MRHKIDKKEELGEDGRPLGCSAVYTAVSLPTFRGSILPPSLSLIALMMGAVKSCETLVNLYQSTRRYNPEDGHLCSHRRENLKSYQELFEICGAVT